MAESFQIFIWFLLLLGFYFLTQMGIQWRIRRAYFYVIRDLSSRGAVDAQSAVELPYARKISLNIGMRDFRRKALEDLRSKGILATNTQGKYYLRKSFEEAQSFLCGSRHVNNAN